MKKTYFWIILILLCVVCACSLAEEQPVTYTSGDYQYILLPDGTAEIAKYSGSAEELAIVSELDGYIVTSIGNRAFSDCWSLTSVVIPDSVTSIGNGVFSGCILSSITIPDSVENIGVNPFIGCDNLSVFKISPDQPALAVIDGVLFSKSDKRLVCFPVGKKETEYAIPQGTQMIGELAFSGCSLSSITIPDSVENIGANPFIGCENLSVFKISPDQPALAVIDGVLFSKSDKRLVCYPMEKKETEYAIPQGIQMIGELAFSVCSNLTSVTIPDTVTSIGEGTFTLCGNLTSITIPNSVTDIGNGAFYGCERLTSIAIPDSVTSIGDQTFCGCFRLMSVTIPDSVTSISNEAFSGCFWLTSVTIPDSVTSIGENAFSDCENLTLTVPRDSYAAQYCKDNNLNYTYPDSLDWLNN